MENEHEPIEIVDLDADDEIIFPPRTVVPEIDIESDGDLDEVATEVEP